MRALRIAALALLPLIAACWVERPNLQSTGGGYTKDAASPGPAGTGDAGAAGAGEAHAETPSVNP